GQTALHGAFLWRQVDVVIELKQNWRAKDDAGFIAMLNRIRLGKVRRVALDQNHPGDYDVLKMRLLSEIKSKSLEQFKGFEDAPIIVTRKYLRDAINETKARTFATRIGQQYHVYLARDRIGGKSLDIDQQRRLWKLQTTNTNDSLGRLPLIPGMPIMITENAATSCKIVNGSRGILQSITYEVDEYDNRFPVCALVKIQDSTLHIPGLENSVVPILPITSSFSFPTAEKNVNVRRIQLPILPGWAFTDFKVQGSYLPKVIVDLTGARSLQSIYVMLSRASKLNNIAILRWFSSRTLHGDLQGDARQELQRLQRVEATTRAQYLLEH
ncbi:hypothetical protein DEU56DRAFT_693837, partial [Suillus clintonianus]|uniref:uncharacterized protein n=1 Tax=Suillus clintonianus TaxID=1904413 RepID=UPI001B86783D